MVTNVMAVPEELNDCSIERNFDVQCVKAVLPRRLYYAHLSVTLAHLRDANI